MPEVFTIDSYLIKENQPILYKLYKGPRRSFVREELQIVRTDTVLPPKYGVSAGKRDQIDKIIFFEIINVLDQMIKSTSILLRNFFLKKNSIWSLFPALTPNNLTIA